MRLSLLAAALSLTVSGVAMADDTDPATSTQPAQEQTMQQQPAQQQPAQQQPAQQQPAQQQPAQPQAAQQQYGQPQAGQKPMMEGNVQPVDLFFNTSSAKLSASADTELKQLAEWARCNPQSAIILEGHADPTGTQTYNIKLSAARAAMVRARLIRMGVPSDHIVVAVFGENGPSRATLAEDRRVTARGIERPVNASDLSG
jgi:outer membrane protein OmpA-like peptidoglycan-associated protein